MLLCLSLNNLACFPSCDVQKVDGSHDGQLLRRKIRKFLTICVVRDSFSAIDIDSLILCLQWDPFNTMADIDQPGNLLGDQPQSDSGNQSQAVQRRQGDESGGQLGFPNSRFPFLNSMALDVKENDNSYDLKADLPGVPKENVNVEVDGDTLTISANRKEEKEDKGDKWHRMVSERH